MKNDLKTLAYVLKRTNYGEADRILNLITPSGKVSAIAKSVRREKSKLAGGIEMFSLVNLNIHFGRTEMGVITSSKMLRYYGEIMKDLKRIELASMILKKVSRASEGSDNAEYFDIVKQCFEEIDNGSNLDLVKNWFLLNLRKISGEDVNVYHDTDGNKLSAEDSYDWDFMEFSFVKNSNGKYDVNDIKLLRLMLTNNLNIITKIKNVNDINIKIRDIVKGFNI